MGVLGVFHNTIKLEEDILPLICLEQGSPQTVPSGHVAVHDLVGEAQPSATNSSRVNVHLPPTTEGKRAEEEEDIDIKVGR